MKIPISWLSEYVDIEGVGDKALSDMLTMSGTENEVIKGAEFPGIVVGEILTITKHPNADKLQLTTTDVGPKNGGKLQIVCGAPNIAVGQKVPVALTGAMIGEFEIKEVEIRGVKSFGMLCSESELGISDDHSGIMVLDPRSNIGTNLNEALNIGGTVLEAEITPNRGDCLSMVGVAREVSALGFKFRGVKFNPPAVKSTKTVKVSVLEKELCPRYMAKVVEGVKIGQSPKWLRDRLAAAGIRPISNIVDVTNYVMLELGQPLHAFDGDKIAGEIIVRKANPGEKLTTLDGQERKLTKNDLVIADRKGAIALAGVMGGLSTEVTEKTVNVVLEAAVFDPTSVRKTAQRLALRSEASNRFEKGIPLLLPEYAIERAADLLIESGGKAGKNTDVLSRWIWVQHIGLSLSQVNSFMGVDIPEETTEKILKSLGFEVEKFDFKKEARKHVGKPYVYGASYKTHQDMAFDCSYLTDYIYSRLGRFIGHTSLAQYELGRPVEDSELKPGDILFVNGVIDKSAIDHYFIPDGKGGHKKVMLSKPKSVGHNALYIGNGRIVHARHFEYDLKARSWKKLKKAEVVEENVTVFTENPEYLGARRYLTDPDDYLAVTVPWWRSDVMLPEDLYEEIGRIYGYENLPSLLPKGKLPQPEKEDSLLLVSKIKTVLSGAGLSEVINYSFVSKREIPESGVKALKIVNPINPEQEYMRTSLVPSLLKDAFVNQDNYEQFSIFEVASKYLPTKAELPDEKAALGLLHKTPGKNGSQAYRELKGVIELLFRKLNLPKASFEANGNDFSSEGQSALITIDGKQIGFIGIVSEKLMHEYDLGGVVAVAEIELSEIKRHLKMIREYKSISRYPAVKRDLNLLFDQAVAASKIEETLQKIKIPELARAEIIDIYEGSGLPEGQKSVTIKLVFVSDERTLSDEETTKYIKEIIALFWSKLKAKERY